MPDELLCEIYKINAYILRKLKSRMYEGSFENRAFNVHLLAIYKYRYYLRIPIKPRNCSIQTDFTG